MVSFLKVAAVLNKSHVQVQAKASFAEEGIQTGGIWVGAYRRKACWDKKNLNKTECSKELQYQWTDRNTVGNLMWKKRWTAGAPHDNTVGFVKSLESQFSSLILSEITTSIASSFKSPSTQLWRIRTSLDFSITECEYFFFKFGEK